MANHRYYGLELQKRRHLEEQLARHRAARDAQASLMQQAIPPQYSMEVVGGILGGLSNPVAQLTPSDNQEVTQEQVLLINRRKKK